jgi:hypothetical protein
MLPQADSLIKEAWLTVLELTWSLPIAKVEVDDNKSLCTKATTRAELFSRPFRII